MQEEYFKEALSAIKDQSHLQKAYRDVSLTETLLQRCIREGETEIDFEQLGQEVKTTKEMTEEEYRKRVKMIHKHKEQISRKLRLLKMEEDKYNKSQRLADTGSKQPRLYSTASLSTLVRSYKRFEKQLEDRTHKYQVEQEEAKRQANQQQLKLKEVSRNKRLELTKENLEIIRQREEVRKQSNEKSAKELLTVKSAKPLYQKMLEKWKSLQEQKENQASNLHSSIKMSKYVSLSKIKEHERRYNEILEQGKNNREERCRERSNISQLRFDSPFYQQIRASQQSQIKQLELKENLPQIKRQRVQEYNEVVKYRIFPNMKTVPKPDWQNANQTKVRTLSTSQLYSKGNEYMKQAHEKIDKNKSVVAPQSTQSIVRPPNYLQDLKANRGNKKVKSRKMGSEHIDSIIDQENVNPKQKVEKLKEMLDKIEMTQSTKKRKQQRMYEAIQMKLKILEKLNES